MKKSNLIAIFLSLFICFSAHAVSVAEDGVNLNINNEQPKHLLFLKANGGFNNSITKLLPEQQGSTNKVVSMACGFKPFPPIGCSVGSCICDQNGNNCQWQIICR
jgi:hypothetical protein